MIKGQNKKKKREVLSENPFEAVGDLGSDLVSSAASDVIGGMADSAISQIFGHNKTSTKDLAPNEEVSFDAQNEEILRRGEISNYQKQRESIEQTVFSHKESVALQQTINELLKEIRKLAKSTENLHSELKVAAMEDMPVSPGKYHVTFFEWLLSVIKSLREQVDDSRSWLNMFQSKKQQKQYWSMFKKHGTSFGLSNERSLATQVG